MHLIVHPDPLVLETTLLERVAEAQEEDPLAPVLIVVPTRRLAQHLRRRVAERHGARLAVDVLHHRAVALRILDSLGGGDRPDSELLLEAALSCALAGLPSNAWFRFLQERPRSRRALLGTLSDLREAGITPSGAGSVLRRSPRETALAEIYDAYVRALDAAGLVDEARLVVAAVPHAAEYASSYRTIFHHGAYELIGVHLDLVRALDRGRKVTFLLPAEPRARAYEHAESFARGQLLDPGEALESIADVVSGGLVGVRLPALYDESATPGAFPQSERIRFWHVQGALAEVTVAVRRAMASVAAGNPPEEVALIARNLAPYAAALEAVLDEDGIAWASPLEVPLRRHPVARDLVLVLRVLDGDFPRAATAELLRSPRLRWSALLPGERTPRGDRADPWSRRAGVLRGLEDWTRNLPACAGTAIVRDDASEEERVEADRRAGKRRREAERLVHALDALNRIAAPDEARGWPEHADRIERVLREAFVVPEDEAGKNTVAALRAILRDMRALASRLHDARSVPFREMVDWFSSAVDGGTVAARPEDAGGIHVLDAMQARGLTFRHVSLLGFQADLFPRAPRSDPFLDDDARRRLREETGRPIAVKSDAEREERLLLALLLGSASHGMEISWQRANEAGKSGTPSPALREVARIVVGKPDPEAVESMARRFPVHPARFIESLAEYSGLLAPSDATLLAALRAADPARAERLLVERFPDLAPGLRMIRSTESFSPGDLSYDARVEPIHLPPGPRSASSLERLGLCPLKHFFRDVLRVREMEEEASAFDIAPRELGVRAHRVLEALYGTLETEGTLEPSGAERLGQRLGRLLERAWGDATRDIAARLERRSPVFWRLLRDRWLEALDTFVRDDTERILREDLRPMSFEQTLRGTIDLGEGILLEVSGRLDRVLRGPSGVVVGDYKSSRRLSRHVDVGRMFRGASLQVPLYHLLRGDDAAVELLCVSPEPTGPPLPLGEEPRRVRFAGFERAGHREAFLETLRVLVSLADAGRFPLNPDDDHCGWCPYRRACRPTHPPTLERRAAAADCADFLDVQRKRSTRPTLASVRSGPEPGDARR